MARGLVLVTVAALALAIGRVTATAPDRAPLPPAAVLVQMQIGRTCWTETDYSATAAGDADAYRSEWLCAARPRGGK